MILFTCHEHIRDLFQEVEVEVRTLPARSPQAETIVESKKPKRRKPILEPAPEPEPVAELPPPPAPLSEEPAPRLPEVDPNALFDTAVDHDEWDPTNAFELAKRPQLVPDLNLPDFWPIAELPKSSPVRKPKKPAPPPPAAPAASVAQSLPDFWPIAEPPAPPPPPPPEALYEVISFRYPAETPPRRNAPPAPPAPPPLPEPVVAEPPVVENGDGQRAIVEPETSPEPEPVLAITEPAPRRQRRARFAWESPEMYWDDERSDDSDRAD
jgi:hypothetical protein